MRPPERLLTYVDSLRPCLQEGGVTLVEGLPSSIVFAGFVYMRGRVAPGGGYVFVYLSHVNALGRVTLLGGSSLG